MSGTKSNPRRNESRRRQMARLRAKGLSHAEIGRHFGVTKQRVTQLLHDAGASEFAVRCRGCRAEVMPGLSRVSLKAPLLCPACLAKTPDIAFGERLKTHRLIAGLTQRRVAANAGVTPQAVALYEKGTCKPAPETLARLVEFLGAGLIEGM